MYRWREMMWYWADERQAQSVAEDMGCDGLSSTVTHVRQLPTCLTDISLARLPLSPTYTSAQSQRARYSASDTAAHMLTTPSSYRASFSRLQPVDIPDVDNSRHGNVISHPTVTDTHKRSHFIIVSHLFTVHLRTTTSCSCSILFIWFEYFISCVCVVERRYPVVTADALSFLVFHFPTEICTRVSSVDTSAIDL